MFDATYQSQLLHATRIATLVPVLKRDYASQDCSVARALEVVGERWTLLIVRDALRGTTRFEQFQESLGIARNVLTDRLGRLCDEGIMRRVRYQERPERFEYRLTQAGRDLYPAVVAIMKWGDTYLADEAGPPVILRHRCGEEADPVLVCSHCHEPLHPHDVTPEPGPGARVTAPAA